MACSNRDSRINRRDFLRYGVLATAAATANLGGIGSVLGLKKAWADSKPTPVYRTLGRTGLRLTVVSFGAMLTPEYEVIRAGFDLGINYVDTARRYMNGRNEEIVGRALKGIRDKVYIATKTKPSSDSKKEIFNDVETSLSKLQTDHIDVIQLHNLTDGKRAFNMEVREALRELRRQGKVRFFGVTTHTNQAEVLDAITNDKERFFDMALVGYNLKSDPEIKAAIARAARAGIGIIAMKTQAGGYRTEALGRISPHQAALKWALQDINVTAAIPGMRDMNMLMEDISVMGMRLTSKDRLILERYSEAITPYYCHLCGQCEPTCPNGVAISVINRCLMYAESYGSIELARSTYTEIKKGSDASVCHVCPDCVARCVRGLDIGDRMQRAKGLFV